MKRVKSRGGQYIGPVKTPNPAPTTAGERKKTAKAKAKIRTLSRTRGRK